MGSSRISQRETSLNSQANYRPNTSLYQEYSKSRETIFTPVIRDIFSQSPALSEYSRLSLCVVPIMVTTTD